MLGETYELVTERFKLLCEMVQHYPHDVIVQHMEGKSFKSMMFHKGIPKFRFNGGRG